MMRILEGIMEVGDFSLALRSDAPRSIRNAVRDGQEDRTGYVVVFDTDTPVPTLSTSMYVGCLTKRVGRYQFEGMGLAGLLQSNDNLGGHEITNTEYASQNLSDWYTDLLPYNGITKGTVTTTGLTSVAATHYMGLGLREMIDYVTAVAGGVWRLNTDATLDAATPDNLFGTTPSVLISAELSTEVGGSGLTGIRGGITGLLIDSSQYCRRVIGYGAGLSTGIDIDTATSLSPIGANIAGGSLLIDRPLDLPDKNGTALQDTVDEALARFEEPLRSFAVDGVTSGVRSKIAPGDPVYVYDQEVDIYDSTVELTFAGEHIQPFGARVYRMEWTPHRGQSVFLYLPASGEWTNLSPYMAFSSGPEQSTFRLTVSNGLGTGDMVKVFGPDRVVVSRPDPVSRGGGRSDVIWEPGWDDWKTDTGKGTGSQDVIWEGEQLSSGGRASGGSRTIEEQPFDNYIWTENGWRPEGVTSR